MRLTMTWLMGGALAALLGLAVINVLIFNALPKPIRLAELPHTDYGVADAEFRRSLDALMHSPLRSGNSLEVLRNGENIYPAMLEAIDQARYSVTFETYEFWGDTAAGDMANALSRAAERGVAVHAVIDFIGSVPAENGIFEQMEEAGVEFVRYREPSWYQLSRFNHRTHRKLLVIDGSTGFIGGANVADNWLPIGDTAPYRDNHFRVTGPVVAGMQAAFAETWLDVSGRLLTGSRYFPELAPAGNVDAQVVKSSPREGRYRMRHLFLYAISAAQESITASTAYFYPDADFLAALVAAADRGVSVRILVPGGGIDQGYLRHASVNRWGPMLEAGVELLEYQPAMYHSKLMSIDDAWATLGSTNKDNRSFRINDEANLSILDRDFAITIRELIEEDILDAERVTIEQWQSRAWYRRFIGWAGAVIGAHL